MKKISAGHLVAVHYTGTLTNGEIFDSSDGRDPLKFEVGGGMVIPGFDDAVIGMSVDQEREISIPPEQAYGTRDERKVMTLDRRKMEMDFTPEIGMQIGLQDQDGEHHMAVVTAVEKDEVTLDLNHPLAGETLNFKIRVVEIREGDDPEREEWLDMGHGCGGCGGHEHGDGCCGGHDHEEEESDGCGGGCCGGHHHN